MTTENHEQRSQQHSPTDELLEALGARISPDLLVQALTHRSFSHEHPEALNYERLEFLGDAVLEFVTTETLFSIHPDMTEGQLAKMRAKAVSEEALSAIARDRLKVSPYILLGRGEAEQGGAEKAPSCATSSNPSSARPSSSMASTARAMSSTTCWTTRWRKSPPKAPPSTGKPR